MILNIDYYYYYYYLGIWEKGIEIEFEMEIKSLTYKFTEKHLTYLNFTKKRQKDNYKTTFKISKMILILKNHTLLSKYLICIYYQYKKNLYRYPILYYHINKNV